MLSSSEQHLQLGYPVKGRKRLLKRGAARVLWPFLRHQIDVNKALVEELQRQNELINSLEARLTQMGTRDVETASELAALNAGVDNLVNAVTGHEEPLHRFEEAIGDHNKLFAVLDATIVDIHGAIEKAFERIELGQRQTFARYHNAEGALRRDLADLTQDFVELRELIEDEWPKRFEQLTISSEELKVLRTAYGKQFEQVRSLTTSRIDALRDTLSDQMMRLARLDLLFSSEGTIGEVSVLPSPARQALFDAAESAFAGADPDIQRRGRGYLDVFRDTGVVGPVVDLASGRGGWLELLHESGISAYGLTTNPQHLAVGKASGFDIRDERPADHLRSVTPGSLGGVVASGLVEQLTTDQLIEMLELTLLALRPDGILVLEAQNPENVIVGAGQVYLNPKNQRPLPPRLLEFIVGGVGLVDVQTRFEDGADPARLPVLEPEDAPWAVDLMPVLDLVNRRFLGPTHYAVTAKRH